MAFMFLAAILLCTIRGLAGDVRAAGGGVRRNAEEDEGIGGDSGGDVGGGKGVIEANCTTRVMSSETDRHADIPLNIGTTYEFEI